MPIQQHRGRSIETIPYFYYTRSVPKTHCGKPLNSVQNPFSIDRAQSVVYVAAKWLRCRILPFTARLTTYRVRVQADRRAACIVSFPKLDYNPPYLLDARGQLKTLKFCPRWMM
jgi:hypothetical protein